MVLAGDRTWVWHGNKVQPHALPAAYLGILKGVLRISRMGVPGMLGADWAMLYSIQWAHSYPNRQPSKRSPPVNNLKRRRLCYA